MKDKEVRGRLGLLMARFLCAQLEATWPSTWGIQLHSNKIRFGWSWSWRPFSVKASFAREAVQLKQTLELGKHALLREGDR